MEPVFRPMRRFKQALPEEECLRILADDADRLARLRSLGKKYFPDGYDTEADILKNGPRAEMLEFTIDHLSGKAVREK